MYACPVCGHGFETPAYDEHGCPSFDICSCCGTEFGYDDATATHGELREKHGELREKWIAGGMRWWSRSTPPPSGWDPRVQLKSIT